MQGTALPTSRRGDRTSTTNDLGTSWGIFGRLDDRAGARPRRCAAMTPPSGRSPRVPGVDGRRFTSCRTDHAVARRACRWDAVEETAPRRRARVATPSPSSSPRGGLTDGQSRGQRPRRSSTRSRTVSPPTRTALAADHNRLGRGAGAGRTSDVGSEVVVCMAEGCHTARSLGRPRTRRGLPKVLVVSVEEAQGRGQGRR